MSHDRSALQPLIKKGVLSEDDIKYLPGGTILKMVRHARLNAALVAILADDRK